LRIEVADSLAGVPAADWNGLLGTDCPFLRHEFLFALEETGCLTGRSGWQPCHLLIRDGKGQLIGGMPLYLKSNSYGEFVFDFAWAEAYRRSGLQYFPKLVSAIPFTPATGTRLLHLPGQDPGRIAAALLQSAVELARQTRSSSIHVLFPTAGEKTMLEKAGFLTRKDCQFHWRNRDYTDFDAFLEEFTAEKRKKARRERRRVREAGIRFIRLAGADIDRALWAKLFPLYASTFWRRGREPYLNDAFFLRIAATMPDALIAVVALLKGEPVATALCFRGSDRLYGRYWGSEGDFHSLHFETCYYQGIEYCIEHGLKVFEPGTQGEHKISRGFVPTETWSSHWLSHPQFSNAIEHYLDRERAHIDDYIQSVNDHVPYRKGTG